MVKDITIPVGMKIPPEMQEVPKKVSNNKIIFALILLAGCIIARFAFIVSVIDVIQKNKLIGSMAVLSVVLITVGFVGHMSVKAQKKKKPKNDKVNLQFLKGKKLK